MAKTKFLFSTDFHGSETVWRKFLNAAKYFDLDALVISGDMTGKLLVPIVERTDGKFDAALYGEPQVLSEDEIPDFEKKCRMITYIPYRTTPEEVDRIAEDEQYREDVFERCECETIAHWLTLIPDRVPPDCKVIISPGNDDKLSIDEVIRTDPNPQVIFGEEEVVELDEEHEVLCFGWSNPTPFNSPRECSEEELEERLERTVAKVKNIETAVFCIHVPPYNTFIDEAPMLENDLSVAVRGGHTHMVPVGSTAVRKIIEEYQPLLGLHGHIHESPGRIMLGRTECLNPGSEYAEGILKGFLVEIDGNKLTQLRRIDA
ncbi:MAG: metallophosphoesterase [Anaerolineae bacterium]|nr:metallophosphoesterase [Anaerolineae bacterium]NIN95133.1 metallophosphoesterase [Anaerolineae bacterium]NIQ78985.1 metallophosphoesterase [Anaerolineae bacterium]